MRHQPEHRDQSPLATLDPTAFIMAELSDEELETVVGGSHGSAHQLRAQLSADSPRLRAVLVEMQAERENRQVQEIKKTTNDAQTSRHAVSSLINLATYQ